MIRGTRVAPLTTDPVTIAMVSAEASTLAWPIIDAACSVFVAWRGTLPRKLGAPRSKSTPMPRAAAASARSSWLIPACWEMNAVLHDWARAWRNGMVPSRSGG